MYNYIRCYDNDWELIIPPPLQCWGNDFVMDTWWFKWWWGMDVLLRSEHVAVS